MLLQQRDAGCANATYLVCVDESESQRRVYNNYYSTTILMRDSPLSCDLLPRLVDWSIHLGTLALLLLGCVVTIKKNNYEYE